MRPIVLALILLCPLTVCSLRGADANPPADYTAIQKIFSQHCLDCHSAQDPEGNLVMETFETLMKGGENGPAIASGKSADSLLVKMIEGKVERNGKKKIMPPGKRQKLDSTEIVAIKGWIDAGAPAPVEKVASKNLVVPKIVPHSSPRRAVTSFAYDVKGKSFALGRYGAVEIFSAETQALLRTINGPRGNVNALVFSADGQDLFAAAGEAGLVGEVRQFKTEDGSLVRLIEGHSDAIYALALSPDGKTLATGSYDQKIYFWEIDTGKLLRTLAGHNGAVYSLAFRPDGKILASGSADRTVKLWDVSSGERRETLSQPLKAIYAVAFSPDGKKLLAGGIDSRIRVWEISESAAETTNPLLEAKFAHEGAILNLVFATDGRTVLTSAEDATVKLWEAATLKEQLVLEKQPDWARAVGFVLENKVLVTGRLDGSVGLYDAADGKKVPPPKPELARADPRGVQRGLETRVKLIGKNLIGATAVKFHHEKLKGELEAAEKNDETWLKITAAPGLKRGPYEISVISTNGESGRIKIYIDDLPQFQEKSGVTNEGHNVATIPASFWGTLDIGGEEDEVQFVVESHQTVVFDLAGQSLGSKASLFMTLLDSSGHELASSSGFGGSPEPLFAYSFTNPGKYKARLKDQMLGASKEHFYRLTVGSFPFVTTCFPLSVEAKKDSEVELIGLNLPPDRKVQVPAQSAGEVDLPFDLDRYRHRRPVKLLIGSLAEKLEQEPNDAPGKATPIQLPVSVGGRIWKQASDPGISLRGQEDIDLFQFSAKPGQTWIIETAAARRGTTLDTKIEVLHHDGKPVEHLLLQAVRDSAITFRGIDSATTDARVENWEEMELNQLLYMQGEIVKIFRMPQGPDSGFLFYSSAGKRRAFFDSSSTAHALAEACYVVEPHPPGTKLVSNGLPSFPLYYANDDDGNRLLGADSRLSFRPPLEGSYLIRVTDTRGLSGQDFSYRLVIREAKPDFKVTLKGTNPTVNAGSGQAFSAEVERIDGFEGEVMVEISGLPPGFSVSSPLVIQAGHSEAKGTINATIDAALPAGETGSSNKVIATASIEGQTISKEVNNLGQIKLAEKPKLLVALEPDSEGHQSMGTSANRALPEIVIAPGGSVGARLKVQRNGHDELITFTVDNLPHGVIVDNIGLNGVLIPKGENERQIFLTAAKWVPETTRLCYAIEAQAGKQTSLPVVIKVRPSAMKQAAR